jgi:hypothetical protein
MRVATLGTAPTLTFEQATEHVDALGAQLDLRTQRFGLIERYVDGPCPLPPSIRQAKVTRAYQMLMSLSETPYGRRIVKAASGRMEVGGIRTGDKATDDAVWSAWQRNRMDAESKRGHDTTLAHGRVFALLWTDDEDQPTITLETPDTVIVEYKEGSRYDRRAALRRWVDDAGTHATLYTTDAIYKFTATGESVTSVEWERRIVADEEWPLPNDTGVVPVVEIATGRRLKAGRYGDALSDLDQALGLLDRINTLEFLRLVIAFTAGFPIRAVIGDKILRDDDDKPIAPFKLAADVIAQFEDPNVKIQELAAADLKSFGDAIDHDVEALAGITATPSYYLRAVPIQNVSADAIRASDSPLNSRVEDHKPAVGEGWEEVLRVAGVLLPEAVDVPVGAEIVWVNRESRSLAERADAAIKLATVMPWQAAVEIVFDATQQQISRWEAMRASDGLTAMLSNKQLDTALNVARPGSSRTP